MDYEHVTAEWARHTSNEILGVRVHEQLNKCLIQISDAASNNKDSVTIDGYVESMTKEVLRGRGFIVENFDNTESGFYIKISW